MSREYFIAANSFAAPFISDTSYCFVEAADPREAITRFVVNYKHPAGLYAAMCYEDANAFYKGSDLLVEWRCNHLIAQKAMENPKHGRMFVDDEAVSPKMRRKR
jgi:hypothetical protein